MAVEIEKGTVVAVLRPPKPKSETRHKCVGRVEDGWAHPDDFKSIIQCSCGKRYKCRESWHITDRYVWVRRILPWPPKRKDV